ncbi:hypothetical protein [Paenibacillus crassostreae]|uniref:Uncharacterized protein n=1 Tax=Paenibacillus crassostreae TaxID=1763538 RepID=A0A167DV37_9BACL|nr:hypothetical protein [Paenibacillus crassostreae]AOZ91026.1 hypothetical protein LPB68_01620 [Paenibacillus crassostreae]OAB74812.1 hypothetical protein PNBC_12335 [Paenibacillus crassostreae]
MKVIVVNKELQVNAVKIISIAGSSVFLVGDSQTINCSSIYDHIMEYSMSAAGCNSGDTISNTLSTKGN